MAGNIKGITIEIGGDTTGLKKALSGVNKQSEDLQSELKKVDSLLKFNPGNTELIAQKQKLLADQIAVTSDKLKVLKEAQAQVDAQFASGKINEEQYRAFQREVIATTGKLDGLKNKMGNLEVEQQRIQTSTQQLETLFKSTGTSVDNFSSILGSKLTNAIKNGTASSKQLDDAINKIGTAALGTNVDLDKMKQALSSVDDGNSIKNVKKELNNLSKEANDTQESIKGVGSELGSLVGGLAAGGGIAGALDTAIDRADLNANIDITFDVPESSKATIKDAINTVSAYGVDAEAALEGVRRQWAMNKDASDSVNASVVKGAGVVAHAFDGVDFNELIQETNEVGSSLKISNQDALALINSLLKAGFPPEQLDTIAEYGMQMKNAGFSVKEIQAIFEKGINVKSWNIDNLNDGVKEARIRMAEFGQSVPKAMDALLSKTNISSEQLQKWGQAVAKGGEGGSKAMGEMSNWLSGIKDKTLQNSIATQIFGTMWEDQGTNLTTVLSGVASATDKTKQNQEQLNDATSKLDQNPAVQMKKAIGDLKNALDPLLSAIASVVSAIAGWIQNNPTLAATIAAVATTIGILVGAVIGLAPVFTAIAAAAGAFSMSIGAVIGIIAGTVAAIAALVTAGVLIYKNWNEISAKAVEIWNGIKDFLNTTLEGIKSLSETVWNAIKSTSISVWNAIKSAVIAIVTPFINGISNLFNGMKNGLTTILNGLKQYFSNVWSLIKNIFLGAVLIIIDLVTGNFKALKSDTQAIFNNIKSALAGIWSGIKTVFSSALSAIKGYVSAAWSNIKSITSSVWNGIKSAISSVVIGIKSAVSNGFNAMKSAVSSAMNGVKSAIENGWNKAKSFLQNINLISIGKNIIDGLVNGIKGAAGKIGSAVKNIADSIPAKIRDILDIHSPSRVMKKIGENPMIGSNKITKRRSLIALQIMRKTEDVILI
ncbi:replication protein [Cytobacillus sp. Hz8]|uniref:replication protein n=1 Tax=Cytobacillus sp. Hz8 TaxID=3347168 RepID=UPI0035D8BE34